MVCLSNRTRQLFPVEKHPPAASSWVARGARTGPMAEGMQSLSESEQS